jgi:hypothetical protein
MFDEAVVLLKMLGFQEQPLGPDHSLVPGHGGSQ